MAVMLLLTWLGILGDLGLSSPVYRTLNNNMYEEDLSLPYIFEAPPPPGSSRDEEVPGVELTGKLVASWTNKTGVNPEELGTYYEGDIVASIARNGLKAESSRWPKGIVPFEINGRFSKRDMDMIQQAMDEYHKRTCIKFVPRTREHQDYIRIVSGNTGCWSSVGRIGGAQDVNFQTPGCLTAVGTPIHELMHAIGFLHEQNRHERDKYVTIQWENIQRGRENNFDKAKKEETDGQGVDYDYHSVMHYSGHAFSVNSNPTIIPKKEGVSLGQREGFSRGDILKIRRMYKCGGGFSSGTSIICAIPFLCSL